MADISKITLPNGASYDFKDSAARNSKTNTSVLPNDGGEIKTKFRMSQKGYTNGATWYYPLCKLPKDNNGNYASAILSGRVGGWVSGNMSSITSLIWNRDVTGIALLDIAGSANAMNSIWSVCDIVVYTNSDTTDTVYLKCNSYFTFDLDIELFQSSCEILYNGSYVTTTPSGTLAASASTSTKRAELINGKLYVAGNELAFTSAIPTKTSQLTNDSGFKTTDTWRGIQNNLTSDSTTDSLSAAQGKVLKGLVDGKAASSHTHSEYALKAKYDDTTINVGRVSGSTVGDYSTAEGKGTTASGYCSHAEGAGTVASGYYSHAEGVGTTASGSHSHAEGTTTTASGSFSHAEGANSHSNAPYSHAEGQGTQANGDTSHAEGRETQAVGNNSHAGGYGASSFNNSSFSHGIYTVANKDAEIAVGKYNKSSSDTLFSVGDGTSDSARHNAFEITTTGGKLHDKDILTSAHCIQFIPYNLKYYAQEDRLLLFSNDDAVTRGIYFVNNTPNDIVVCALISATGSGPVVQYGYGSNTYPDIQNTGEGREWFSVESAQTSPTIYTMTVPSGKLGFYGIYFNSESTYTTIHDIRCPYFNYF